jgi:hypothetical protein
LTYICTLSGANIHKKVPDKFPDPADSNFAGKTDKGKAFIDSIQQIIREKVSALLDGRQRSGKPSLDPAKESPI